MKKILSLLLITITSCVVPQHIESDKCCDKQTYYEPYFITPSRVIVINKNKSVYTKPKRHIKVKVNKHRKRK
tara:strand:+ start:757 stop:972 length:216 start_codon:yes stop_codon:yes gene_type:complete